MCQYIKTENDGSYVKCRGIKIRDGGLQAAVEHDVLSYYAFNICLDVKKDKPIAT